MKWISSSLLIALLSAAALGAAPRQYDIVPAPKWVDVIEGPMPGAANDAGGGTEYLLTDTQERLDRVASRYEHFVSHILNTAGVDEHAQIEIDFDPKLESLHLHQVQVIRPGEIVDELKRGRIRMLQQEGDLDDNLIDGRLTFHLLLTDLRVGDRIDYSYTIDRREPAWNDRFTGGIATQWSTPVSRVRTRISLPMAAPLFLRTHPQSAPKSWQRDGYRYYEWDEHPTAAVSYEKEAPDWFEQFGGIEYSQFADWGEVVRAALPLFAVPAAPTGELRGLIERFKQASDDPHTRLLAAVRFVQDEIRYTGIEEGIGAVRPTAPQEVLARRFGDCKDKTLLAVTLLRGLGIEAVPALVSTRWRQETKNRLAGPFVMNHAVLRAELDGKDYWFDATATGQGGTLETVRQAHFGWALPISSGVMGLVAMPEPELTEPFKIVYSTIDLSKGNERPATLTVLTSYLNALADLKRRELRSEGRDALGKTYLRYYQNQFAGAKSTAPLKVTDDREHNRLSIEESYEIERIFKDDGEGTRKFYLEPAAVNEQLGLPSLKQRSTPYEHRFPYYAAETFEVLLPGSWEMETGARHYRASAFDYTSNVSYEGKQLKVRYEYKSLADHVDAKDFPAFLKTLEKARDDAGYKLTDHVKDSVPRPAEQTLYGTAMTALGGENLRVVKLVALFAALFLVIRGLRRVYRGGAG